MKKYFNWKYLILLIVLPQLLSLGYMCFTLKVSDISDIIIPLIIILFTALFFTIYSKKKSLEQRINPKVFVAISIIYTSFILFASWISEKITYREGYASPILIFILGSMVSVLYGIIGFLINTPASNNNYKLLIQSLVLLIPPLIWFLGGNVLGGININAGLMVIIIAIGYFSIFIIMKLLVKWTQNRSPFIVDEKPSAKYYTAVIIIAILMPLFGLSLNLSYGGLESNDIAMGLFGNFSHPLFFIIALVNGLLLLVPRLSNLRLRLLLFYLKSAGFTYILYFFIVFLPILPLGFVGIVFFGLGLLIFAPAMVTILQGYHLFKEAVILKKSWGKAKVIGVFIAGLVTIPLCMGLVFYGDKVNFQKSIQYLQTNDADKVKPVSLTRLNRSIRHIKSNLFIARRAFDFSMTNTPIISNLYSNFVLDDKIISKENVILLENLFFDKGNNIAETRLSDPTVVSKDVTLLEASSTTSFDEKNEVYRSWVNLKLKNKGISGNGEYQTIFKLPEGAYITDYYLDVNGTRKEGILTDRRAALFMYQKIVNTSQDPGLLHYIGKNTLELRVFPFAHNEVRETGFEIIHSKKFTLLLDDKSILLDGADMQKEVTVNGVVLLTAEEKSQLKSVVRKAKYYFVIDSSKNSDVEWNINQVKDYVKINNINSADVIFASDKLKKCTLSDLPQFKYKAERGFNLNLAVKDILSKEDVNCYPIIIAVSDNLLSAVMPYQAYNLSKSFPECSYYYGLNHDLTLKPYSFEDNSSGSSVDKPIIAPVLDYNGLYVLDNGENELVITECLEGTFKSTHNQYEDAIQLHGLISSGKADPLDLVRGSFRNRILTPHTAFVVLETQEQEKELLDLQEKLLTGEASTPTVTLDEPSWLGCAVILLVLVFWVRRKKKCEPN